MCMRLIVFSETTYDVVQFIESKMRHYTHPPQIFKPLWALKILEIIVTVSQDVEHIKYIIIRGISCIGIGGVC